MENFSTVKVPLKERDIVGEAKQLLERFTEFDVADAETFFDEGIYTLAENTSLWFDLEARNSINYRSLLRQYPINYNQYQGYFYESRYFVARYFNELILSYLIENKSHSHWGNKEILIFHLHNRSWIEAYYGNLEQAQGFLAQAVNEMMHHVPSSAWWPEVIEHFAQVTKLIQGKEANPELFELKYGYIHQLLIE